ncbi:hypothetical protein V8E36_004467, partial [Tilletia maclaganii]
VTALKAWHEVWGLTWTRHEAVTRALTGVAKLAPAPKPKRPPVTTEDLAAVRRHLQPSSNNLHAAVWACALFSFFGVCRLAETTVPTAEFFNPQRHVTRDKVEPRQFLEGGVEARGILLPWTKATRMAGMRKVISLRTDILDPLHALDWHAHMNQVEKEAAAHIPLFAYRDEGVMTALTKDTFLGVFANALEAAGRPAFEGHSFRIGGVTHVWHNGAGAEECRMLGGWRSSAFLLYLRDEVRGLGPLQAKFSGPAVGV